MRGLNLNIKFIGYDSKNSQHLIIAKELLLDKEMIRITGPLINNVLLSEEDSFLIEMDNAIIGAIDFNVYDGDCYVSYCILKSQRGNRFSNLILNYIKTYVQQHYPEATGISLRIEPDNEFSIRAALRTGYTLVGDDDKGYLNYSLDLSKINSKNQ